VGLLVQSESEHKTYKAEEKLLTMFKDKFYQTDRKTALTICMGISILKVNETLKLVKNADSCVLADPWRFDIGKLRRDALTCRTL
jgi:hypothetical protein